MHVWGYWLQLGLTTQKVGSSQLQNIENFHTSAAVGVVYGGGEVVAGQEAEGAAAQQHVQCEEEAGLVAEAGSRRCVEGVAELALAAAGDQGEVGECGVAGLGEVEHLGVEVGVQGPGEGAQQQV